MKRRSLNLATLFFRLDNKIFRVPLSPDPEPHLHDGGVVAQLAAEVLVVAGPQRDHRAVTHLAQRDHLPRPLPSNCRVYWQDTFALIIYLTIILVDSKSSRCLECCGQSFVAAPVAGQRGAENIGAACLDKFPGVLSQDLRYLQ